MKKKVHKKLMLRRHTLQRLQPAATGAIRGGTFGSLCAICQSEDATCESCRAICYSDDCQTWGFSCPPSCDTCEPGCLSYICF
jgi:hypothetical protein